MWWTFRGLTGNRKAKKTGENIALKLGITDQELADSAGDLFFPSDLQRKPLEDRPEFDEDTPMNAPFNMEELCQAVSEAMYTAPGPDKITVAALQNLPEKGMEQLPLTFNTVWENDEIPKE